MKRIGIFLTAAVLAPLSPWAYGEFRGAGYFIKPYLEGSAIAAYGLCLAMAIPGMWMISKRANRLWVHFFAAIGFIVGYAIVCGIIFSYAEDWAEQRAIAVGYRGDNGPRDFWDDSGMSAWPSHWGAILGYCVLTGIIWLPAVAVATIVSGCISVQAEKRRGA